MSIDTDYKTLREVLALYPQGWAIEFGVFSGYSLALISDHMPVIGLDSFTGLPEDWREDFPMGAFSTEDPPPYTSHAIIVPGLFEDTVPYLLRHGMPHFGLVHIDCDLYSSTVTALEGIKDHIGPGTYIVFDEYEGEGFNDEARAWRQFCARHMILSNTVAVGEEERAFVIQSIGGSR